MNNQNLLLIFTVIILLCSNNVVATDYYVCDCAFGADPNCVVGDDSNNGLSANFPWRSTAKVNSIINSLQAGDQILFAKGGAWNDATIGKIYNTNSTANTPIVIDSYNPIWGGSAKPILTESRVNTNLFIFEDGGNADHDEGYIIRNMELRGEGTGQWGIFVYNDADHIHLENLDISGFGIGIHCAGSNTPNPGADSQNQHMTLLNSRITDCSEQGFLGGGDYLLIESCLFENNGFARAIYNHNVYVSKGDHGIIRNNELYHSAVINGKADGVSLVVHGTLDNLLIEGNYIHEDLGMVTGNAWGIAVDPGYNSPEAFTNLIIRGNLVVNMYNVSIGVASAPGVIIENNIIINEDAAGLRAIAAPDRTRGVDDLEMTKVLIRNNTIYLRQANGSSIGIKVGDEGFNHEIVSNLISMDNGNGFSLNLPDQNYSVVDYNMLELLNNTNWGSGQNYSTWSSTRGFDLHSIYGDPQFTSSSLPNYDLTPLSTSPVTDSGHPALSSPIDYTGSFRDGLADIGAIEVFNLTHNENQTGHDAQSISCFPNPTHGRILIISDVSEIGTVYSIYNYQGQLLQAGVIDATEIEVELNPLPSGNYIIVFGRNRNQAIKVTKN